MSKLINVIRDKYSVIPNEIFKDRRLDYRSKGLLCMIFSLPDGWEFSAIGLSALVTPKEANEEKGEGKAAIRVCLKKLERLGYLERIPTKDSRGKFTGYDYKVNIPPITVPTTTI